MRISGAHGRCVADPHHGCGRGCIVRGAVSESTAPAVAPADDGAALSHGTDVRVAGAHADRIVETHDVDGRLDAHGIAVSEPTIRAVAPANHRARRAESA